jgi:copper chaperone
MARMIELPMMGRSSAGSDPARRKVGCRPALDLAIVASIRVAPCHEDSRQEFAMIEFTIPAMSCGHCVGSVTRAVQQVDASAKVAIDLPTHRVRIETTQDRDAIVAALRDAGYEPSRAAEDPR